MMIKLGRTVAVDVTGIDRVAVKKSVEKTLIKKGFWRNEYKEEDIWEVVLEYTNGKGKPNCTYLYQVATPERAEEVYKEVLQQIREIELVSMTSTLEDAIRKS